jgi:D-sedoheptulose 7-phosphate isomerase
MIKKNLEFFDNLKKEIKYAQNLLDKTYSLNNEIKDILSLFYNTLKNKKKIFICGNGGSASDAEHLSTEFLVRLRPKVNRKAFPIINLGNNLSFITACANDYNFEMIFQRSLEPLVAKGDVLWVLSTSGNSKNIIRVLKYAKNKKIKTVSFLGKSGGLAKKYSDINLIVPSNNTARIQEIHKFVGHFILEHTENKLIKKKLIIKNE